MSSFFIRAGEKKKNAIVLTFIGCIFWSSIIPVGKLGLGYVSPVLLASLRFLFTGIMLFPLAIIYEKNLPKVDSDIMIISIVQIFIAYIFFFRGLNNSSGTITSIIVGANPLFAMMFSCILFKERGRKVKAAGMLLGITGIALAAGGISGSTELNGEGFIFISSILIGFGNAFSKRLAVARGPIGLAAVTTIIGGAFLLPVAFMIENVFFTFNTSSITLVLLSAVSSSGGYVFFYTALRHHPVSEITSIKFTVPVLGVFFSIIFLGESMGIHTVLSVIMVSLAIWIVNEGYNCINTYRKTYIK